jgi:hypothetical protein
MSRNSFPLKPLFSNTTQLPVVQNITLGASGVAATNAVSAQTYAVQLNATSGCWILFAPTAAAAATVSPTNGFLFKSTDFAMQIGIPPGYFIGAVEQSAAGTLNIMELTH